MCLIYFTNLQTYFYIPKCFEIMFSTELFETISIIPLFLLKITSQKQPLNKATTQSTDSTFSWHEWYNVLYLKSSALEVRSALDYSPGPTSIYWSWGMLLSSTFIIPVMIKWSNKNRLILKIRYYTITGNFFYYYSEWIWIIFKVTLR